MVLQVGTDLWNAELSGWRDYVASGVAGAAAGEAALHAGYVSGGVLSAAAAGATFGATHATTLALLNGELPSVGDVATEAGVGAIGGAAGGLVGVKVSDALAPVVKGHLGEALSYGKAMITGKWGLTSQVNVPLPGPGPRRTVADWTYGPPGATRYIESKFGNSTKLSPAQRKARQILADLYMVERWNPDHVGSMIGVGTGAATTLDSDPSSRDVRDAVYFGSSP